MAFRKAPKSDRPVSFNTTISPSMMALSTSSSAAAFARAMPMAKLSEGDTITMTGEVTLVHDDGTVKVRLHGYDVPVTTRGERLAEIPDLSTASALGNRDSMLGFRHIDTDVKNVILLHGPSFLRLGLGSALPSNPRLLNSCKA
ncbi:hypothetical protein [Mesorhizobium sp.]|uniref:hypothetical protein n=3 Tax=Mesorhizobium sp. TaxID=1871066 RepID=UPI0025F30E70|nr:hypothetical protein [Mesorhizobium sp.]